MQAHYFVGLDIAAETFTTAVGTSPWTLQVAATEFAPAGVQLAGGT